MVAFVRRLLGYWGDESSTAPRMGNHSDPDIDFAEVFAMDGLSTSYAIRNIFGLFYTQELFEFLHTPPPDVWNRVQRSQAIGALGLIAGLRGVTPRAAWEAARRRAHDRRSAAAPIAGSHRYSPPRTLQAADR